MKTLILIFALALASNAYGAEFDATVPWVIDGDSIYFEYTDKGKTVRDECRMLGYNAPEMTGTERPLGKKALKKLIAAIKGKRVTVKGERRDKYGRLLCEVSLPDGTQVGPMMRKWITEELQFSGVGKYDHLRGR